MWCIDNRCTDIYFNLAAEEYLLKQKRDNFFMLWQSAPSVVIGKHQCVDAEVDEEYIRRRGIALARRFSGGGAVYHDEGNINLSFIETVDRPDFDYYLQLTLDFLEQLGISAYSDERMGIYVDGCKVSGSAQCIHKDRVMYHCTLLFDTDLEALKAALRGDDARLQEGSGAGLQGDSMTNHLLPGSKSVRAVPSVPKEVTNLSGLLSPALSVKRFMRLLLHSFLEEDGNELYRFSEKDMQAIECLKRQRYAREEWIREKEAISLT